MQVQNTFQLQSVEYLGFWQGARVERRKRKGRGAEEDGCGRGVAVGGVCAVPLPRKFFYSFEWKWRVLMHPGI